MYETETCIVTQYLNLLLDYNTPKWPIMSQKSWFWVGLQQFNVVLGLKTQYKLPYPSTICQDLT